MADRFADDTVIERSPEVLWRRVLDGVLVLGPGASEAVELSSPGDVVWALTERPTTVGNLVEMLAEVFDVSTATLRAEIRPTLEVLVGIGALAVSPAGA